MNRRRWGRLRRLILEWAFPIGGVAALLIAFVAALFAR
jgi:hypothetical protein